MPTNNLKNDYAIVLLDTNFLLIPAELKVDIFSELNRIMFEKYKVFVLDKNIEELENIIKKGNSKTKLYAKIAKEILKRNNVRILKTRLKTKNFLNTPKIPLKYQYKSADDLIFEFALGLKNKKKVYVATQDKKLKKRLKKIGVKIIVLRKKSFLMIE